MATIPNLSITLPVGNSTTSKPMSPAVGTMRFNSISHQIEAYDGTNWITIAPVIDPQTWREWLEKFANDLSVYLTNRREYINSSMQKQFPGNYHVDLNSNGEWELVFDTPADETWWHLKYD